jgi:hypothetical protein
VEGSLFAFESYLSPADVVSLREICNDLGLDTPAAVQQRSSGKSAKPAQARIMEGDVAWNPLVRAMNRGTAPKKPSSSKRKVMEGLSVVKYNHEDTGETVCIVVGRNSGQNERVTFEVATTHDLWFHAQVQSDEARIFWSWGISDCDQMYMLALLTHASKFRNECAYKSAS